MQPLQVQAIIEILGRPPENVSDALSLLVSKISSEEGIKVLENKFHAPVLAKESKDLYTAFVELTLDISSLEKYFVFLFSYMPAHCELVYPEKITLENTHLNQATHFLLQRLHQYDAVTKNLVVERELILKKIQQEAPYLLKAVTPSITRVAPSHSVSQKGQKPRKNKAKKSKKI